MTNTRGLVMTIHHVIDPCLRGIRHEPANLIVASRKRLATATGNRRSQRQGITQSHVDCSTIEEPTTPAIFRLPEMFAGDRPCVGCEPAELIGGGGDLAGFRYFNSGHGLATYAAKESCHS